MEIVSEGDGAVWAENSPSSSLQKNTPGQENRGIFLLH